MLFGCKWKLLRYIVFTTFFIICVFTIYFPDYKIPHPKQVRGWEWNVTRDIRVYIIPENLTAIISGKEICQDPNLNLVIIVSSAPENTAQRYAIRQTWASHNLSTVKVGFIIGSSQNLSMQIEIEEESKENGDVIQEKFIDTYNNLTIKSMMMLKWFLHYCPSPRYLMKTDDDMFVNVVNLSALLANLKVAPVLIGALICKAKPITDVNSKWYIPKYMYNKDIYPNYLSGTGYVMSRGVAATLYETALLTTMIHLEDVYLTGICAAKAGIKPRNHAGFSLSNLGSRCVPNMITNHRLSPQELHIAWAQRNNCTSKVAPIATRRTKIHGACF